MLVLSGMPAFEKQAVARALEIKSVHHIPESELHRKVLELSTFVQLSDAAKLQLLLRYKLHNITDETIKDLPWNFLQSLSSKFLGHRDGTNKELRESILSSAGFHKQIERVREHGMTLEPPVDDCERITQCEACAMHADPACAANRRLTASLATKALARLARPAGVDAGSSATHHPTQAASGDPSADVTPGDAPAWHTVLSGMPAFEKQAVARALGIKSVHCIPDYKLHHKIFEHPAFVQLSDAAKLQLLLRYKSQNITDKTIKDLPRDFLPSLSSKFLGHRDGTIEELHKDILSSPGFRKQIERVRGHGMTLEPPVDDGERITRFEACAMRADPACAANSRLTASLATKALARLARPAGVDAGSSATHHPTQAASGDPSVDATPGDMPAWHTVLSGIPAFEKQAVARALGIKSVDNIPDSKLHHKILVHPAFVQLRDAAKLQLLIRFKLHNITDETIKDLPWNFLQSLSSKFLGHRDGTIEELREGIMSSPGFRKQIERVHEHGMTLEPPDGFAERITQCEACAMHADPACAANRRLTASLATKALARLARPAGVDAGSSATHHPTQAASGDPSADVTPGDAPAWHTVLSGMPAFEKQAVARALGIKSVHCIPDYKLHHKIFEHPAFVQLSDAAKLQLLLRYKSHNITDKTIKGLPRNFLHSLSSKFLGHRDGTNKELREGIMSSPGFRKQIERVREHGMTLEPPADDSEHTARCEACAMHADPACAANRRLTASLATKALARLTHLIDVDAGSPATHHPTQLGSGDPSVNATPSDALGWHTVLSDMPTFEKRAIAKALGIKSVDNIPDSKLHRKVLEHPVFVQHGDAAKLQLLLRSKSHNITDETIKDLPWNFLRSLSTKFLGHCNGTTEELREGILLSAGLRKQIERVREHGMTLEPPVDDGERITRCEACAMRADPACATNRRLTASLATKALAGPTHLIDVDAESSATHQPVQAGGSDPSVNATPGDMPAWHTVLSDMPAFEKQAVAKALGIKPVDRASDSELHRKILEHPAFVQLSDAAKFDILLRFKSHNITDETIKGLPRDFLQSLSSKFLSHRDGTIEELREGILSSAGFRKQIERVREHGMTLEPPVDDGECITRCEACAMRADPACAANRRLTASLATKALAGPTHLIDVDAESSATHQPVQAGGSDPLVNETPDDMPAWHTVLSDMPTFEKRAVAKALGIKSVDHTSESELHRKILEHPAFVQLSDAAKFDILLRYKSHNITDGTIKDLPRHFLQSLSSKFLGHCNGTNKELREGILSSAGFRKQIERVREHGMTLEPPVDDGERITQCEACAMRADPACAANRRLTASLATKALAGPTHLIDVDAESSATHQPVQAGGSDPSVNATPGDMPAWHTVLSDMPAFEKQAVARALGIKPVDRASDSELHRKILEHPAFVQLSDAAKFDILLRFKSHNITDKTIKGLPRNFLHSLSSKFLGHRDGTIEELREGILSSAGFRKQIERVREHGMTLEPPVDDGERITQCEACAMRADPACAANRRLTASLATKALAGPTHLIDVDAESSATHQPVQAGGSDPSVNATPGDMPAWHTVLSDMPAFEKRAVAKALGVKPVDCASDSELHRKILEHPAFVQLSDAAKFDILLRYKSHNITDGTIKDLPRHFLQSLSSKFLGHRDGTIEELREGILSSAGFRKQIERVREHGMTLEPPVDDGERITQCEACAMHANPTCAMHLRLTASLPTARDRVVLATPDINAESKNAIATQDPPGLSSELVTPPPPSAAVTCGATETQQPAKPRSRRSSKSCDAANVSGGHAAATDLELQADVTNRALRRKAPVASADPAAIEQPSPHKPRSRKPATPAAPAVPETDCAPEPAAGTPEPSASDWTAALARLGVAQLQGVCRSLGISTGGTKPQLLERIAACVGDAQRTVPQSILAIDIGLANLGFAHIRLSRGGSGVRQPDQAAMPAVEISDWGVEQLGNDGAFTPMRFAGLIQQMLDARLLKPDLDTVLIERMSWRPLGPRMAIPHTILRATSMEAMLVGMLHERARTRQAQSGGTQPDLRVTSVQPGAVSLHFGLSISAIRRKTRKGSVDKEAEEGDGESDDASAASLDDEVEGMKKQSASAQYTFKKRRSVAVVRAILASGRVRCPPNLRAMFEGQRKRDDLSDSLLVALAYAEWHTNALALPTSPLCQPSGAAAPKPRRKKATKPAMPSEGEPDAELSKPRRKKAAKSAMPSEAQQDSEPAKPRRKKETKPAIPSEGGLEAELAKPRRGRPRLEQ
ncbi:hypothetical protein HK105_200832 [Polyrhizophydium stewartii]|uniref:SAP domain-containing protein n=1 Tax=Polyrhizophydium stewartii TaxID=2732419 RepID=A0ABR4NK59_9FUNG